MNKGPEPLRWKRRGRLKEVGSLRLDGMSLVRSDIVNQGVPPLEAPKKLGLKLPRSERPDPTQLSVGPIRRGWLSLRDSLGDDERLSSWQRHSLSVRPTTCLLAELTLERSILPVGLPAGIL